MKEVGGGAGDSAVERVNATDFEGECVVAPGAEGPIEVFMVPCGEVVGVKDVEAIRALHEHSGAACAVILPEGEVAAVAGNDTGEFDGEGGPFEGVEFLRAEAEEGDAKGLDFRQGEDGGSGRGSNEVEAGTGGAGRGGGSGGDDVSGVEFVIGNERHAIDDGSGVEVEVEVEADADLIANAEVRVATGVGACGAGWSGKEKEGGE